MQDAERRMQNEENQLHVNLPPDWSVEMVDLLCPLCGYNLRGLVEGRCPECGFSFAWQELRDAEANRHNFIFEHGSGRNIKTFWKTYWTTCRPRKFWRDLNPAHPVKLFRLIIYSLLTTGIVAVVALVPYIRGMILMSQFLGMPYVTWQSLLFPRSYLGLGGGLLALDVPGLVWAAVFSIWPWLTLISLLIFRYSMRRAKIRTVHLLRTVIYACDFGLLFGLVCLAITYSDLHLSGRWLILWLVGVCCLITSYRLTIAFEQYLRIHLPLSTVLASQVISFLFVFIVLVQIADFSRHI